VLFKEITGQRHEIVRYYRSSAGHKIACISSRKLLEIR